MFQKQQAIGKLLHLLEQCDTASVVRLADEVEDTLEIGPWGICHLPQERREDKRVAAGLKEMYDSEEVH